MRKNKRGTNNSKKVHRQSGGIVDYSLYSLYNPEELKKRKDKLNSSLEMSQFLRYQIADLKKKAEREDPSSFVNLTISIRLLTKRYIEALEQEIASNEKRTQELKTENENKKTEIKNYEEEIDKIQKEIDRLKDPPDGALGISPDVKEEWLEKIADSRKYSSDVLREIGNAPPEVKDDRDVMLAAAKRTWRKALKYASLNLLKQLAKDELAKDELIDPNIKDAAEQNLENNENNMKSKISNYTLKKNNTMKEINQNVEFIKDYEQKKKEKEDDLNKVVKEFQNNGGRDGGARRKKKTRRRRKTKRSGGRKRKSRAKRRRTRR